LSVFHHENPQEINDMLAQLDLDSTMLSSEEVPVPDLDESKPNKTALCWVLGINFCFFLIEIVTGWISHSMGLVADSLDMLADSFVYGLSIFAISTATRTKKRIAKISGYFQMSLAAIGFMEVIRRFFYASEAPLFGLMIVISVFALVANVISLRIIQKVDSNEAHMKASYIFTSNDIIVNLGVIFAGVLVFILDSRWPDLIVGGIVFAIVMKGAFKILQLAR
jgi:Co/Zn/Cd efflux system component